MTRFFYSDPHEAAFMAKHYGMRIFVKTNSKSGIALSVSENMAQDAEWRNICVMETGSKETKYYIHPESLHLLNALQGDEGADKNGYQARYTGTNWEVATYPNAFNEGDEVQRAVEPVVIDKRSGKHFFWPQFA
jgi:hypothetical protein